MLRALVRGLAMCTLGSTLAAGVAAQLQDIPAPGSVPAGTPESPSLVLHINFDAFRAGVAGSRLSECWGDPVTVQWRETIFAEWLEGMRRDSPVDQQALLDHLTGDAAVVLQPEGRTAQGVPRFRSAVAFRRPGGIAELQQLLQPAIDRQAQGRLDYAMRIGEDVLAVGNASAAVKGALAQQLMGGAAGLGLEEPAGSFLSGRIDYTALWEQMRASGQLPETLEALLYDLGFLHLGTLNFSARFEGGGIASNVALDFTEERSGLFNQLGADAPFACLRAMPPTALLAAGVHLAAPEEVFRWFEVMLARHSADAETRAQEFETAVQTFRERTGLDLRREVLPALGTEMGFTFGGMSALTVDLGFYIEVRDAAVIQRLIDGLLARLNEEAAAQGRPALQPSPFAAGNLQAQVVTLPTFPGQLCYAFTGSQLIVTTSATEMTAIGQALASGQSLAQAPGFTQVLGQDPSAVAFAYRDSERLLQGLLQLAAPIIAQQGAQVPPELNALLGQMPALTRHTGARGMSLSAQGQRLSLRAANASGAEYLLMWMLIVTSTHGREILPLAEATAATPEAAVLASPEPLAPVSPETAAPATDEALLNLPAMPAAPSSPPPASPEVGGALLNLPPPPPVP